MKKILCLVLTITMLMCTLLSSVSVAAEEGQISVSDISAVNYADSVAYPIVSSVGKFRSCGDTLINSSVVRETIPTYVANCAYSVAKTSNDHFASNVWFAVDLGAKRDISKVEIVQHYDKIRLFRLFYTNDDSLWNEIKDYHTNYPSGNGTNAFGLSEKDRVPFIKKVDNVLPTEDSITETSKTPEANKRLSEDGIIDRLTLIKGGSINRSDESISGPNKTEGSLINGINDGDKYVDEINFDEVSARYLVFVCDSTYGGQSLMLWAFRALGVPQTSVNLDEFPPVFSGNYADKSVYPNVEAITTTKQNISANGEPDSLVNPNSEAVATSFNQVLMVITSIYSAQSGVTKKRPWVAIDLGEERSFDEIRMYQARDRLREVEIYSITEAGYGSLKAFGQNSLSDSFTEQHCAFLGKAKINHGGNETTELNSGGELTTPSVVKLDNMSTARYVLVAVADSSRTDYGIPVYRIEVRNTTPKYTYDNVLTDETEINCTAKLCNNGENAKKVFFVAAQYADDTLLNVIGDIRNINPTSGEQLQMKLVLDESADTVKIMMFDAEKLYPIHKMYTLTRNLTEEPTE